MTDTLPNDIGARMLADRTAKKLSRSKYAAEIGLTAAKVGNLEKGRPPKHDEVDKLQFLVDVDPVASTFGVPHPETPDPTPPGAPDAASTPVSDAEQDHHAQHVQLVESYNATVARLAGKPCPPSLPYHTSWGTPDVASPAMWPRIMTWCSDVNAWLDQLVADEPSAPEDGVDPVFGEQLTIDEPLPDDELLDALEEDQLAVVTDAPWVFPDDGIRRISNGQLKTFKRCRRKYWLTHYRKLGLPTHAITGAAPLGTRVHRCLAVYYVPEGQVRGDPLAELERTLAEDLEKVAGDEAKVTELLKEVDLARAMLEGYLEWLAETGADSELKILASETKVEVDARMTGGGVHLIAKLDVRAERTLGASVTRVFIDHKTVGDLTSPMKMLAFDEQMLHYDLCEFLSYLDAGMTGDEAAAIRTDGALYNMLRKVKRTATANPPFYDRVEVRHNIETIRSYWLRVQGTIDEIVELERKLDAGMDPRQVAYPTPTRDCSWDCDFYHVCTMFDDGSRAEDMITNTFVTVDPLQRYAGTNEGHTL